MPKAFSVSVASLAASDPDKWPRELISNSHLIYSSPATLAFNSPGAQGFGVKRAGLSLPNSVMLLFSPGCCGRNTSAVGGPESEMGRRMYYLLLNETDIVTGRYLQKIVDQARAVMAAQKEKPEIFVLCSTCVDALLGTDMERLTRSVQEVVSVPVLATTMYALTREGHIPPMQGVRQSIYSLLPRREKKANVANLLGFFTHLCDDCELYELLHRAGITTIHELGRKRSLTDFQDMAHANFNLVLHPEARLAAQSMAQTLNIPFIELTRSFELDKIHKQYQLLAGILERPFNDTDHLRRAQDELQALSPLLAKATFALGETSNAEPYGLALALVRMGAQVKEIFADPSVAVVPYLKALAQLSPETRIYSNLSPSMLFYEPDRSVTCAIGRDACYYHPECAGFSYTENAQPFGYQGLIALLHAIRDALTQKTRPAEKEQTGENAQDLQTEVSGKGSASLLMNWTPFAPDQSGVVSALYELGGLTVVCDAGGCTGNYCGFDEPRLQTQKSALFSAGLRDMDAILGRDDRLIKKTREAVELIQPPFVAIVGTPVPCVIGTDFTGLARLGEKALSLPVLTFPTTGTHYYDQGLSMAWLALFERFAREHYDSIPQSVGVLGASPLDLGCLDPGALIAAFTQAGAQKVVVHGLGFSLTELQAASKLARNIVLSPAGFAAAKLLRERFQTPYTFDYPLLSETFCQKAAMGNNILIIHQQVAAHVLREKIRALNPKARITCASFFMQLPELLEAGDQHLEGEAQLKNLLLQEGFDLIVADSMLMRGISPASTNALLDFPHFAVSGRLS